MSDLPSTEMLKVILQEVQQTRKELREHIKENQKDFDDLKEKFHATQTDSALTKQRVTLMAAGIAVAVSGLFTYLMNTLGPHVDK